MMLNIGAGNTEVAINPLHVMTVLRKGRDLDILMRDDIHVTISGGAEQFDEVVNGLSELLATAKR